MTKTKMVAMLALSFASSPVFSVTTTSVQSAQLSWLPPSTSYLPLYRGPLTQEKGSGPARAEAELLAPAVVSAAKLPVAQRFDRARAAVLGQTTPMLSEIKERTYRPEYNLLNGAWRGYCNQWSAWTSSDGALVKDIESASDLVCDGTFLSKAEVKELVTLFYPADIEGDDDDPEMYGLRYDKKFSWATSEVRATLGTDSLNAEEFDEVLFSELKDDHGIVANLSTPGQIWNFPVYRADARIKEIEVADLAGLPSLPAELFSARTSAEPLLKAYDLTYQALSTYTLMDQGQEKSASVNAETHVRTLIPSFDDKTVAKTLQLRTDLTAQAFAAAADLGLNGFSYRTLTGDKAQALLNLRQILYAEILTALANGEVGLNPKFLIQKKATTIFYGKENPFANDKVVSNDRQRVLEYVMYQERGNKDLRRGVWISPSSQRPGFIWVAVNRRDKSERNPYRGVVAPGFDSYEGMAEVWQLRHSCESIDSIKTFLAQVQTLAAERAPDQKSLSSLKIRSRQLKSAVNPEALMRAAGSSLPVRQALGL